MFVSHMNVYAKIDMNAHYTYIHIHIHTLHHIIYHTLLSLYAFKQEPVTPEALWINVWEIKVVWVGGV